MDNRFTDIIQLIKQSRTNAINAVNAELMKWLELPGQFWNDVKEIMRLKTISFP